MSALESGAGRASEWCPGAGQAGSEAAANARAVSAQEGTSALSDGEKARGVTALQERHGVCPKEGNEASGGAGAETCEQRLSELGLFSVEEAPRRRKKAETEDDFVKVKRRDLERLTTEVMQLRDFLPKILAGDILGTFQKLDALESNMEKKEEEVQQLKMDCEHFRARLETAQADCMREKKEKLDLRQHLHEAKQQLLQQAEYCTEMGAAVCTLLWGVSSSEEAVKNILGASKAVKFFTITAQTMESFVKSLNEDMKQQDLDSDENQFVLALAGIVTNVAALACGREFLVTSNRELLDTMMQLLGDMKPGLCTKFKVLMLMSLYNVSINLKGLKYISESPGFIPLLWWLLNDPDTEVCLHVLRLLQSVILEPEVLARSAPEMRDTLPFQRIIALSKSRNADLQALARELLEDLKILEYEA